MKQTILLAILLVVILVPTGAVFAAEPDNYQPPAVQIVIGLVVALFGCLALAPLFLAERLPR